MNFLLPWAAAARLTAALRRALYRRTRLPIHKQQILDSGLFDPDWYARIYPDVLAAGLDPADHYLLYGAAERRNPSPAFDADFYLNAAPSLSAAHANPLIHYLHASKHGLAHPPAVHTDPRVRIELAQRSIQSSLPRAASLVPPHDGSRQPVASICILNYNKPALTLECLAALLADAANPQPPFEVLLIDNASQPNSTPPPELLHALCTYIRLPINRFFGEANNLLATLARAPNLIFLNNDTRPLPGWISPLISTLASDPAVGAVGSALLYADGTIQELGAHLDPQAQPHRHLHRRPLHQLDALQPHPVDYCSAAALAIPTPFFIQLGGFDYLYEPGYYEDSDLCRRIRNSGRTVLCQPQSRVIHFEHSTMRTEQKRLDLQNLIEANRARYLHHANRWTAPAAQPVLPPTPPNAPTLAVHLTEPLLPTPENRALLQAAAELADQMAICILTQAPASHLRLRQLLLDAGLPCYCWPVASRHPCPPCPSAPHTDLHLSLAMPTASDHWARMVLHKAPPPLHAPIRPQELQQCSVQREWPIRND